MYLADNWPNSDGVGIELVNAGFPIPITSTVYNGNPYQVLDQVVQLPNWGSIRDSNAADLVIVFSGALDAIAGGLACGAAVQYNWTNIMGDSSPRASLIYSRSRR